DLLRSLSCLLAEGEGPARWTGPDCFEIRIRTRRERFVFFPAADGSNSLRALSTARSAKSRPIGWGTQARRLLPDRGILGLRWHLHQVAGDGMPGRDGNIRRLQLGAAGFPQGAAGGKAAARGHVDLVGDFGG